MRISSTIFTILITLALTLVLFPSDAIWARDFEDPDATTPQERTIDDDTGEGDATKPSGMTPSTHDDTDFITGEASLTVTEEGQELFVKGSTSYPDQTELILAMNYQLAPLHWSLAVVERNSYESRIAFLKKLAPGYYELAVTFYPDKQPARVAEIVKDKPVKSIVIPFIVGTDASIIEHRKNALKFYEDALEKISSVYQDLREAYCLEAHLLAKNKVPDFKRWEKAKERISMQLEKLEKEFEQRRQGFIAPLFPAIENLFTHVLISEVWIALNTMSNHIYQIGEIIDPHTGKKLTMEWILGVTDPPVAKAINNIRHKLNLESEIDRNVIRYYILKVWYKYQALRAVFYNLLPNSNLMATLQKWNRFCDEQRKEYARVSDEFKKGTVARALKDSPDVATDFGALPGMLSALLHMYDARMKGEEAIDLKAITKEEEKFRQQIFKLVTRLGLDEFKRTFAAEMPHEVVLSTSQPVPQPSVQEQYEVGPDSLTPDVEEVVRKKMMKFTSEDDEVRRAAITEVVNFGPVVIPIVRNELDNPDKRLAGACALVLGALRDMESLPVLIEMLPKAKDYYKIELIEALGHYGSPQAVPALQKELSESKDARIRYHSMKAISRIVDFSAMEAILIGLGDTELSIRQVAKDALVALFPNVHFKFDPTAPPRERAKQIESIRGWWEENKENLIGSEKTTPDAPEE